MFAKTPSLNGVKIRALYRTLAGKIIWFYYVNSAINNKKHITKKGKEEGGKRGRARCHDRLVDRHSTVYTICTYSTIVEMVVLEH